MPYQRQYSGRKRKASVSVSQGGAITIRNPMYKTAAKPAFIPGKSRSGGFYGRYTGRRPELKFFDTTHSFSIDNTGEVPATGQLNLVPQGVAQSERVGRKMTIKSIQTQLLLSYNPAASTAGNDTAFVWVVMDKQCNGAAAALGDVFSGASTTPVELRPNMANSDRFVILKKWQVPLLSQAGVSAAYGRVTRLIKFYKKCNIEIDYDATASTGAIGTIRSNNLFLVAGSNEDDATSVAGFTRIRYSDI